jgi:FtsP/CotA-like multicopper oxidase with cupredoxin domain
MRFKHFALIVSSLLPLCGFGQTPTPAVCPRFAVGSVITAPADVYSVSGILRVNFEYQTTVDANGNTLFCFMNSDGSQAPTLHVNPGDRIVIALANQVPSEASEAMTAHMAHMQHMADLAEPTKAEIPSIVVSSLVRPPLELKADCGIVPMTPTSVNMHFHGTNTPPTCHQDEVIRTMINSGERFEYDLESPSNEPSGLYWYHPHVHGISEAAVQGGASGAIIVEGIQNINPSLAGLAQQLLIVRDNNVPAATQTDDSPSWDLSLNYVPIPSPDYTPAVIQMKPSEKQLWRVLNASADTILDVELDYDASAQPLQVVALDGVPIGSQDGNTQGSSITQTHVLIPPAGRAEFVVTGPSAAVKSAILKTLAADTGPGGDNDPERPLAAIQVSSAAIASARALPGVSALPSAARFANLAAVPPTTTRDLYFSEVSLDPFDSDASTIFFITVAGQQPRPFDPSNPPAIVTNEGAIEDWTIENHTMEKHEFHIHQIHFLVMNNTGTALTNGQYLDTIDVPYWSGTGPYPSVTLRMDFRGVSGDFVYHCHILAHEDGGMMATIRVNPAP